MMMLKSAVVVMSLLSWVALGRRCEEITIPMCRRIGYNLTSMPNEFNHDSQEEAGLEVHQFWPLVEINCSPDLKFFLCSMYAPICMEDYPQALPACRSVCLRAKAGCMPLMQQYGFLWPERMQCEKLPIYGTPGSLCMDHLNGSTETSLFHGSSSPARCKGKNCNEEKVDECACRCRSPLVALNNSKDNATIIDGISSCALPCHSFFPGDELIAFINLWLGSWAAVCCGATFLTLLTFFVDTQRFKYPERPIIFLSGCYFMVSVGYLVRVAVGHEAIACDGLTAHRGEIDSPLCLVVFLLLYFFSMASSIWWVVLSLTWLLAAGLKWGSEAIASYANYFHFAAWLIPAAQTVAALSMHALDGDPVSGICFPGAQGGNSLTVFVIIPLCAYLFLGTVFLMAGFVSLFRIRSVIKNQGRSRTDKLEKLMIRIGIFSVLYTLPASVVVACFLYEQVNRNNWMRAFACPCEASSTAPYFSVYMLKYLMSLAVGITSGFWTWSGKTIGSWRRIYARLCGDSDSDNRKNSCPIQDTNVYLPLPRTCKQPICSNLQSGMSSSTIGATPKQFPLSHV